MKCFLVTKERSYSYLISDIVIVKEVNRSDGLGLFACLSFDPPQKFWPKTIRVTPKVALTVGQRFEKLKLVKIYIL